MVGHVHILAKVTVMVCVAELDRGLIWEGLLLCVNIMGGCLYKVN